MPTRTVWTDRLLCLCCRAVVAPTAVTVGCPHCGHPRFLRPRGTAGFGVLELGHDRVPHPPVRGKESR